MYKYLFFQGNPNLLSKINKQAELESYFDPKAQKGSQQVS